MKKPRTEEQKRNLRRLKTYLGRVILLVSKDFDPDMFSVYADILKKAALEISHAQEKRNEEG